MFLRNEKNVSRNAVKDSSGGGGKKPLKSVRTVSKFITLAAFPFVTNALWVFNEILRWQPCCLQLKPSAKHNWDITIRPENWSHNYTIAFIYPSTRNFGIALNHDGFFIVICSSDG